MRDTLAVQLEALGLEVKDAHNVKKTLLPTQGTQTEMELLTEQQAAVSTITTPTEPLQHYEQYTLPQDLHNFIQTTTKLNTEYHTNEYIMTVQESTSGKRMLYIQQKSDAATSQQMPELSQQDISEILNPPAQNPTLLQSLPGTTMIPVSSTSQIPPNSAGLQFPGKAQMGQVSTDPQPSTSGQGHFPPRTPALPVPPASILEHAQDLLKKHTSTKLNPPKEPTPQLSTSHKPTQKDEQIDVINDHNEEQEKPEYVTQKPGKPIPLQLQNPKRFYCECG